MGASSPMTNISETLKGLGKFQLVLFKIKINWKILTNDYKFLLKKLLVFNQIINNLELIYSLNAYNTYSKIMDLVIFQVLLLLGLIPRIYNLVKYLSHNSGQSLTEKFMSALIVMLRETV